MYQARVRRAYAVQTGRRDESVRGDPDLPRSQGSLVVSDVRYDCPARMSNTVACETLDAMCRVCGVHCGILFAR